MHYTNHHTTTKLPVFFLHIVLLAPLLVGSSSLDETEQGRVWLGAKPNLIFPPTSPTRHQLIAGIGIPVQSHVSVTVGWVLKAQYFLPTTVDQLRPDRWEGWNNSRRSLSERALDRDYERYTVTDVPSNVEPLPEETEVVDGSGYDDDLDDGDDNYWMDEDEVKLFQELKEKSASVDERSPIDGEPYNTERSRWVVYKMLEKAGEPYGLGGRACMLRSICEAAAAQFTHAGGVFSELFHILFTPSTTSEPLSEHRDSEYLRAEQLGREGAPCQLVFHECRNTILDVFTGVHDSDTDLLSVAHDRLRWAI
ncbi:uncharacterized protein LOC131693927 [Topomyia yanbarensis]|uniref:uncharacterized protein LOC131693927 n=1 Tax=Topomyia yanbarensis TaxID=2498891 RepID=UPI00273B7FB2|nr:uncharacterized protein LOC131693927 [Topomyia yanbarensis]